MGIDEPVTWHPPQECCDGLDLPGRVPDDIDRDTVHHLLVSAQRPLRAAAAELGTSVFHIRHTLTQPLRTSPPTTPAKPLLTRDFLDREYLTARKSLRQIARETGHDRNHVARCAKGAGITLRNGAEHARIEIDADWLAEQYLVHKRSIRDIAEILGVGTSTIARGLRRHAIPVRAPGPASHPGRLITWDNDLPEDIRRAITGKAIGWQRLARFRAITAFPNVRAAARHLGVHPTALSHQLRKLESDIGTKLLRRATATRPMEPTERGKALLRDLAQPEMGALRRGRAERPHQPREQQLQDEQRSVLPYVTQVAQHGGKRAQIG